MKHLKIFEAFGTDEYYLSIDEDEYLDDTDIEFMDNDTANRIRKKVLSYINADGIDPDVWELIWNNRESKVDFEHSHNTFDINLYSKDVKQSLKRVQYDGNAKRLDLKKCQRWTIEMKPDEWFIVRITDIDYFGVKRHSSSMPFEYSEDESYYKCDQWDGLVRLFKDVLEPQIESMGQ
jgi:hypothetical protein